MSGRILAVDPGEKNIGLAISDPGGIIASPLAVIQHTSRLVDAAEIAQVAKEYQVTRIIIGQPLDWDGRVGPQARKSIRLAEAVRSQSTVPVELWDEAGSTQVARAVRIEMGVTRKKRKGHMDEIAATVILQSYLDAKTLPKGEPNGKEI